MIYQGGTLLPRRRTAAVVSASVSIWHMFTFTWRSPVVVVVTMTGVEQCARWRYSRATKSYQGGGWEDRCINNTLDWCLFPVSNPPLYPCLLIKACMHTQTDMKSLLMDMPFNLIHQVIKGQNSYQVKQQQYQDLQMSLKDRLSIQLSSHPFSLCGLVRVHNILVPNKSLALNHSQLAQWRITWMTMLFKALLI